jgi:hypothetical protein
MRFGKPQSVTLARGYTGTIERTSSRLLRRPWVRVGLACCIIASLAVALGAHVFPARAHQQQRTIAAATLYGPSNSAVQAAVSAASWPQQHGNWCGIATIAAIAQFRGQSISQQDVVTYLNSDAGVSEWGTPSKVTNQGPGFSGDIARDAGSDPRSLAASLTFAGGGADHVVVDVRGNWDATQHLAADLVRSNEPISVIVYHGFHSVLVSGVYATANPETNPSSITGFDVWDPGVGVPGGNIQPDQEDFVSLSTWLNSQYYWGSPYAPNYFGSIPYDPDPAVGPYINSPSTGKNGHLWIGHYVYIRPDAASDPFTAVNPDWEIDQSGALIEGFLGETPTGYSGPVTSIPTVVATGESSIDSPAFWSEASQPPVAAAFAPKAALAWTGTDSGHHLNLSVSTNGLSYTNKITLAETSFTRPSVIVVPNATKTANVVVISWAGTDANHSLNVMYDVYGARKKVTFSETSSFAPSLAYFNGQIWMAWIGTDTAHTVNVRATGMQGLTLGAKKTLWGNSSPVPPTLVADPANNQMLLTWEIAGSGRLNLFRSPDGVNWSSVLGGPSSNTTVSVPSVMAINPAPADSPAYYWAWAGTDSAHLLNLERGTSPSQWSTVDTLGISVLGTPSLAYVSQSHAILAVWFTTAYPHYIYVATIPV